MLSISINKKNIQAGSIATLCMIIHVNCTPKAQPDVLTVNTKTLASMYTPNHLLIQELVPLISELGKETPELAEKDKKNILALNEAALKKWHAIAPEAEISSDRMGRLHSLLEKAAIQNGKLHTIKLISSKLIALLQPLATSTKRENVFLPVCMNTYFSQIKLLFTTIVDLATELDTILQEIDPHIKKLSKESIDVFQKVQEKSLPTPEQGVDLSVHDLYDLHLLVENSSLEDIIARLVHPACRANAKIS